MSFPVPGELVAERYRVHEVIGQGGFAIVVRATDERTHEVVALKLLADDAPDPRSRARFVREAQIHATLQSAHTVRLLDFGSAGARSYIAFEFVPGEDLSDLLQRVGRLSSGAVAHVLRQLLAALAEAHRSGLIHRDIKPQNIRVVDSNAEHPMVKLLDFGIARATDNGHPSLTATGELVGTPRYMSPEQLTERPLTAASDVYSLGLVALELLVGTEALPGNRLSDQLRRLQDGAVVASEMLRHVEPHLLSVVERMTHSDPGQRLKTASAVLRALDFEADATDTKPTPPNRRSLIAIVAGCCALAAIVVAIIPADEPSPRRVAPTHNPRTLSPAPSGGDAVDVRPEVSKPPARPGKFIDGVGSDGCQAKVTPGLQAVDLGLRYVPFDYDPTYPHPLMILLNTDGRPPQSWWQDSQFRELAERERMIVVMPVDPTKGPPRGLVKIRVWRNDADDDIIRTVAANARDDFCVDLTRQWIVGTGYGGRAVQRLRCDDWVAGVVYNSWVRKDEDPPACNQGEVPTMFINPTQSTQLSLDGEPACARPDAPRPLEESERAWRRNHSCKGPPDLTSHGPARCRSFHCDTAFVSCLVPGGEGWPGEHLRVPSCDEPPAAIWPAEEAIWQFFQALPPKAVAAEPRDSH